MSQFPQLSQIDCVVSDLDGTLLNADHQISENAINSIQALVKQDVVFMLATGRHYQDVHGLMQKLGVEMCLITSNGARVHNDCGKLLYHNAMPEHLVAEVIQISRDFSVHRNLYQNENWWVEEPHEELLAIHASSGFAYRFCDFDSLLLNDVDKLYFNAGHDELLKLEKALQKRLGDWLCITFTSPEYLEVMNLGVSKAQALAQRFIERNICPTRVLALGDGMNDIEMLNFVGHRVVMDNASERVKSMVDDAIGGFANHKDGVALCLQQLLAGKA